MFFRKVLDSKKLSQLHKKSEKTKYSDGNLQINAEMKSKNDILRSERDQQNVVFLLRYCCL